MSAEYVDHFADLAPEGVGFLSWTQFERFRRAVEDARKYVPWLRVAGYIKMGSDPDELMSRSSHRANMPLGIPATWLAAEEIVSLLAEINRWPTLEDVARFGSKFALQLTREVETAAFKWPLSDRAHAVQFFRCQACQQMTLRYYPPRVAGEALVDSVVKCTEKTCRAVVDEVMFTRMALLIEIEQKEKRERDRRLAAGKRSATAGGEIGEDDLPVG
jgi:hypothetical protein